MDGSRGVIIPALDLDPESDFQLFEDSGTGFRSSKNWNRVMILALDPEPEKDFHIFGEYGARFLVKEIVTPLVGSTFFGAAPFRRDKMLVKTAETKKPHEEGRSDGDGDSGDESERQRRRRRRQKPTTIRTEL